MKYLDFKTHDFMEDAYFRLWVRNPDAEVNQFWEDFLLQYPQKNQEVLNAKNLLLSIEQQVQAGYSTRQLENDVFLRIKQQIHQQDTTPVRRNSYWTYWAAAASIILLIGLYLINDLPLKSRLVSYVYQSESDTRLIERNNDSDIPVEVSFDDGSTVILEPKSKIRFTRTFLSKRKREVYLEGEAFFEVAKNPKSPFYVYANELVTKVLGTSFSVSAFNDDKNVTVKVRTGKVSVAIADGINHTPENDGNELSGMLLLPNQKAVLTRKEFKLVKTLTENPEVLKTSVSGVSQYSFIFRDSKVIDVFKVLQKAYGVGIKYDETLFANCQFTADLTEESLYEKLDIICKSIEASYQIIDAQIVVSGKGCN